MPQPCNRQRRPQKADLTLNASSADGLAAATGSQAARAWPSALPDQVRAVAQVLVSASTALPQTAIEARFKGRGAWKKSLSRILDTRSPGAQTGTIDTAFDPALHSV